MLSDPFSMAPAKALEAIGKALSLQYERWQLKAVDLPSSCVIICLVMHAI